MPYLYFFQSRSARPELPVFADKLLDSKTLEPVSAAWVIAIRAGAPPLAKNTKTGGDGTFQVQELTAGTYSVCVQAAADQYLDPCQLGGSTSLTLSSGQAASGVTLSLAAASVVSVQVEDPQYALSQTTKDGRRPDLTLGVWTPKGLYFPAHSSGCT